MVGQNCPTEVCPLLLFSPYSTKGICSNQALKYRFQSQAQFWPNSAGSCTWSMFLYTVLWWTRAQQAVLRAQICIFAPAISRPGSNKSYMYRYFTKDWLLVINYFDCQLIMIILKFTLSKSTPLLSPYISHPLKHQNSNDTVPYCTVLCTSNWTTIPYCMVTVHNWTTTPSCCPKVITQLP